MWQIRQGDCQDTLKQLDAESAQTCVTSPPYWHLRDYGNDGELGSEATPELFVERLVAILAEVRRVLKSDGTLWLNLGDTYAGGGGYCPNAPSNVRGSKQSTNRGSKGKPRPVPPGCKRKDLIGVPWMAAIALRQDGWYLRSDIIWDKPNGFPENVTDRPSRTHEYLFLLSKSPKYFYDAGAIREPDAAGGTRNCRSIWQIAKSNFAGAHFATFPEKLVERCLLASSRPGDCVLDPFSGSGTTGAVAVRLGRTFVGVELSTEYCEIARQRIASAGSTPAGGGPPTTNPRSSREEPGSAEDGFEQDELVVHDLVVAG